MSALDATASQIPEVMPTASILREEARKVNEENNATSSAVSEQPKKPRGRPRKDATDKTPVDKGASPGFVGGATQRDIDPGVAQRVELAKQVVALVEQSGCMIAGDAAKMPDTERSALGANFDNYMKAKNINDIPPGVLLAMGLGMYYGRVLNTPDQNQIPIGAKLIFWLKQKFSRKNKHARPDHGNDRQRQDDTGQSARQAVSA